MLWRRFVLWPLNILALVALVEATLLIWHALHAHELYYWRSPAAGAIPQAFQLPGAVFQPYYGYTLRPGRKGDYIGGTKWRANNFGFQNVVPADGSYCCEYVYHPKADEYVVGIFGGSVGSGYALSAQIDAKLARALAGTPGIDDRRIVVLNFAHPGFRQPQQLSALAYFISIGQKFDLVVNIDGFNEVVTSWKNWSDKVEPSYPADTLWGAWGRQLEQANAVGGGKNFLFARYHQLSARTALETAERCATAICFYGRKVLARYHSWRASKNVAEMPRERQGRSLFPTRHMSDFSADFDVFAYTAEIWRRSSLGMARLAEASGARYLHLLQPDQWYRKAGAYRPINVDHIYAWVIEPVNRGYDRLRIEGQRLIAAGVAFHDLSLIFRGRPEREVYVDDCCHYTSVGYDVVFAATAEALRRAHAPDSASIERAAPSALKP